MKAIIDYGRYAIGDISARSDIVRAARQQLAESGAAAFPGFVLPEALLNMVTEGTAKQALAYRRNQELSFNVKKAPALDPDSEVAKRISPYRMWVLGSDLLAQDGALRQLYLSKEIRDLMRDVADIPALFNVADPLIDINLTYMGEGDQHGWHFDDNDFVVSLILQLPEKGGEFQYAPDAASYDTDQIAEVLDCRADSTRTLAVTPGTLLLFQGSRALHRVSPVQGTRHRMIALLSYHTEEGFVFPLEVKRNSLGRSMSIHEPSY